jgi:hypothetical protein
MRIPGSIARSVDAMAIELLAIDWLLDRRYRNGGAGCSALLAAAFNRERFASATVVPSVIDSIVGAVS